MQWEAIAEALGTGRTAMACFVQVKKAEQLTKGKGAFTDEEQQKIREGIALYGQNWSEIASHVGSGRNRQQVMHHYKNVMDVLRKGKWSDHEDRQLAQVCKQTGCLPYANQGHCRRIGLCTECTSGGDHKVWRNCSSPFGHMMAVVSFIIAAFTHVILFRPACSRSCWY